MRREIPDRTTISGAWESGGRYPDQVTVTMSDGATLRYRVEAGDHPGFLRSMEILRSWPRIRRRERRAEA